MKKVVSAFKVKKANIYNGFRPLITKTTLEPVWDGNGYKLTIGLNWFGKILDILLFPVAIAYDGIPEAFRAMKDDLETGATFSMIYEKANNKFSIVEALYNEAEMK